MNEILNNPNLIAAFSEVWDSFKEGLAKITDTATFGLTEWIKFIQARALFSAIECFIIMVIGLTISIITYNKWRKEYREKNTFTDLATSLFFINCITAIWAGLSLDKMIDWLVIYFAPIGSVINSLAGKVKI